MEQKRLEQITVPDPNDAVKKLILKLRWIGMEKEAQKLAWELRNRPAQNGTVVVGPLSTD